MVNIEVFTIVKSTRQVVYALLKDLHKFPSFMQNVSSVDVVEMNNEGMTTSWKIKIDGADIFWTEKDVFDDKNLCLRFKMLEGDYNDYEGEWRLEQAPSGTKIVLRARFDWGLPALEKLAGKTLEDKARRSLRGMLHAIKNKIEKYPHG